MWTKKNFLLIIFLSAVPAISFCQRTSIIFTPSPNSLQSEFIIPAYLPVPEINLPVYRIEIIDNRLDENKIGFAPVYKNSPREIKLNDPLPYVIKKVFADGIKTDSTRQRKMMVVIQHCWISYFAENKFNFLKKNLMANLSYNLECFTASDSNYYPLKRMNGNLITTFIDESTTHFLVDSMIHLLQHEVSKLTIAENENPKTVISETKMNNYILEKKAVIPGRFMYGIYASYDDFIKQKTIKDSIDIIPYKDYYNRNTVAANLGIIKNGTVESCNKYWGFFDGRFLFYNTGNGFFVRMIYSKGQFVFADLQQLALNSIKKSITSESVIGNTHYNIIKDYGKAFHLFFQLNYEDGKLY